MSIILAGVGTGIISATNSYRKIVQKADAMTLLSTIAISIEADMASARKSPIPPTRITIVDEEGHETLGPYRFDSGIRNYPIYYDNIDGQICCVADDNGTNIVIPVATEAAHTYNLESEIEYSYNSDGYFEYTIKINTKKDASGNNKNILNVDYVTRIDD